MQRGFFTRIGSPERSGENVDVTVGANGSPITKTLPASWYCDQAIYNKERRRIFQYAWWPIGAEGSLQEPGMYRAENLFGYRIFVIRDQKKQLKAFHNICRHRASILLEEGIGHCKEIRCPYHGWLYEFDGTLRKAPAFSEKDILSKKDHSLFPVRVDIWRGLIFVCLSEKAPDLLDWLGSIDGLCADFPAPSELNLFEEFEISGSANWKTYCDNTVEGYHLNLVHPRLASAVAQGEVKIKSYDEGRVVAFHVTYGDRSEGAQLRGRDALWLYRFPGFQLTASAHVFKAERIEPVSPTKLRSVNWLWYQGLDQTQISEACEWSKKVVCEDLGVCEKVQANLQSGVYQDGPLSPLQEVHVARFQSLVRQAIESS